MSVGSSLPVKLGCALAAGWFLPVTPGNAAAVVMGNYYEDTARVTGCTAGACFVYFGQAPSGIRLTLKGLDCLILEKGKSFQDALLFTETAQAVPAAPAHFRPLIVVPQGSNGVVSAYTIHYDAPITMSSLSVGFEHDGGPHETSMSCTLTGSIEGL